MYTDFPFGLKNVSLQHKPQQKGALDKNTFVVDDHYVSLAINMILSKGHTVAIFVSEAF